ncbi:MAG: diguanylate cyclase [Bradymonadia bacterium]|jgi:diguanylate cyclase (GGDEF)-like protein
MNPAAIRKLLGTTWPAVVPLLLATVALQAGWSQGLQVVPHLGGLVLGAALLFAWRFNRSRLVYAAATLGLAALATDALQAHPVARAAVLACVPLNFVVWTLVQERGLLTPVGLSRWALFAVEAIGVWTLLSPDNALVARWLVTPVFSAPWWLHPSATLPAALAWGFALLVLAGRAWRSRAPVEIGLAGALVGASLMLHAAPGSVERAVYLTACGLVLALAMVEASHTLAYRDELTGLPGRRALNEALQQLGGTYTLAMLDVDHFKKFNDSYGHEAGDQCLRYLATHLADVGGGGRAFRYGGEEFTLLFPGREVQDVAADLEALRAAIAGSTFAVRAQGRPKRRPDKPSKPGPIKQVQVTVSIGACERNDALSAAHEVMERADKRLYKSKKDGRNRVTTRG